ncbi:MAG TPA: hypothetical protein VJH94_00680 [Candidatus Paceibacterota bacterium]
MPPENTTNGIAPLIKGIFEGIKGRTNNLGPVGENETLVQVNSLTSTAGTLYEKFRYLLDYKDEHAIKRSAVARILKRKLLIEGTTDIGLSLLQELITGGYLPNKSIPERISVRVQAVVNPYILLHSKVRDLPGADTMIVGFAASEVSRFLFPTTVDEAVLNAYFLDVRDRVKVNFDIAPDELDTAIYTACRRGLLREDNDLLGYALWLRFSKWSGAMQTEDIDILAQHFGVIQQRVKGALKRPLGWELVSKLKNYSIYFAVLHEVIERYGMEAETVLKDRGYVDKTVREILTGHYKKENSRTTRSAIRAIIYIFCTKLILAFILEFPYDYYVLGSINYIPLGVNVLFHPVLLFVMTRIRPLGDNNTSRILGGLHKIIRGDDHKLLKIKRASHGALSTFFTLLYLGLFLICFGILITFLIQVQFNWVGIILFLFFLTLVSYFGLRIRHNAKRWQVRSEDEGTISLLWGVFTLPIIRAGQWLTRTFASINIFVFFMDFIVEAPFKLVLGISDAFTSFLREKREETF